MPVARQKMFVNVWLAMKKWEKSANTKVEWSQIAFLTSYRILIFNKIKNWATLVTRTPSVALLLPFAKAINAPVWRDFGPKVDSVVLVSPNFSGNVSLKYNFTVFQDKKCPGNVQPIKGAGNKPKVCEVKKHQVKDDNSTEEVCFSTKFFQLLIINTYFFCIVSGGRRVWLRSILFLSSTDQIKSRLLFWLLLPNKRSSTRSKVKFGLSCWWSGPRGFMWIWSTGFG